MSGLNTRLRRVAYGSIGAAMALLIGCQDDYYDSFGFSGSSGASGTGSFDSGAPARASFCDDVSEGAPCYSTSTDSCERGSSANYACNAHLRCNQSQWEYELAERLDCRTDCPSAYTETFAGCDGKDPGSLICEFDKGICGCAPIYDPVDAGPDADAAIPSDAGIADAGDDLDAGDGGRPDAKAPVVKRKASRYEWRCITAKPSEKDEDAGVRCPRVRPREGQECVRPMTCDYGACVFEDGYRMGCYAGSWVRDLSRSTLCDR